MGRRRMRTLLLVPMCGLLWPDDGSAQVTLGLSAGAAFASLEGDDAEDALGTTDGLLAGATLAFPVGDVISLVPGLFWAQKGAEGEFSFGELEISTSWIELPVLAAFRLTGPDRPLAVSLFLGPSVAFELSCESEVEVGGEDGVEQATDCDDDLDLADREKVDFGAVFGGGVALPLGSTLSVTVNGGLDLGLRSIGSGSASDVRNSMWFLMAGVALPLGG